MEDPIPAYNKEPDNPSINTRSIPPKHVAAIAVLVVTALLAAIGTVVVGDSRHPIVPKQGRTAKATSTVADNGTIARDRPTYAYSVIPGGVYSREEIAREVARDRVVRAHYAEISTSTLMSIVLRRGMSAYVSFRKAGRVYWTRRPVHINAGETILAFGGEGVRARCGNRISHTPRTPVTPDQADEPSESELNMPVQTPGPPDSPGSPPFTGTGRLELIPPSHRPAATTAQSSKRGVVAGELGGAGSTPPGYISRPAPFAGIPIPDTGITGLRTPVEQQLASPPMIWTPSAGGTNPEYRPILVYDVSPAAPVFSGPAAPATASSHSASIATAILPGVDKTPSHPTALPQIIGQSVRPIPESYVNFVSTPVGNNPAVVSTAEPGTPVLVGIGIAAVILQRRWRPDRTQSRRTCRHGR